MSRTRIAFTVGILVLGTACGTRELARGPAADVSQALYGSSMVGTPVTSVVTSSPTVDLATDPVAQRAIAYTREQVKIKSGAPIVRLARPVTPQELKTLGLGSWNFTPGCVPPLYLVILEGDFELEGTMPSSIPAGKGIPAKFLVYVYDLKIGEIIAMFGDPNGAQVKQALGDPTLPTVDPASLPHPEFPAQMPCSPVVVPGAPAPPSPGGPVPPSPPSRPQ